MLALTFDGFPRLSSCVPDSTDPCSLGLCEQKCSVLLGRVICTCFAGYRFDQERRRQGLSSCVDVDECQGPPEGSSQQDEEVDESPCEQTCVNSPGSYSCACREGYLLDPSDNRTCVQEHLAAHLSARITARGGQQQQQQSCYASCYTTKRMKKRVRNY